MSGGAVEYFQPIPTPPAKEPEILTADEVAGMLRVSVRTVFRLNLPSVKLGRKRLYLRERIMDYLREKET